MTQRRVSREVISSISIPSLVLQPWMDKITAESGGRIVQSIINQTLLPDLSRIVLTAVSEGNQLESITVAAKEGAFAYTPA